MRELKLKIEMQYPVVKELYTENYLIFLEGAEIRIPTSSHVLSFAQIVLVPKKNLKRIRTIFLNQTILLKDCSMRKRTK